ncbi:hypothetical protein T4D_1586 [Trichinella pseudospiralis]|uniref:Uncharacterized protein n=1 Tax=Trichinella pseudospiralis TaxID=6337 RepID=A0A0V1FUM3_TRIPS|nr:hypothetical protein T4D_1586 [Trichinella pseudospiralis]
MRTQDVDVQNRGLRICPLNKLGTTLINGQATTTTVKLNPPNESSNRSNYNQRSKLEASPGYTDSS